MFVEPERDPFRCRPVPRKEVRLHTVDDEAVVYDLAHDAVHYLNTTARFIWERCDGKRTAAEIEQELAEAFDCCGPGASGAGRAVLGDVRKTLAEFADNGLICLLGAEGFGGTARALAASVSDAPPPVGG